LIIAALAGNGADPWPRIHPQLRLDETLIRDHAPNVAAAVAMQKDIWSMMAPMRSLQKGHPAAVDVPSPTFARLQGADPSDTPSRVESPSTSRRAVNRAVGLSAMRQATSGCAAKRNRA
jgi:hypothetical protein